MVQKCDLNKKKVLKCVFDKTVYSLTYQNMRVQNAYLSRSMYLKRVLKKKVKVRLNWSISLKLGLIYKILYGSHEQRNKSEELIYNILRLNNYKIPTFLKIVF